MRPRPPRQRWARGSPTSSGKTPRTFRIVGPDETASNRLQAVFEATDRQFLGAIAPTDEHVAQSGRVVEVLSKHLCQGWLEG